MQSIGALEGEAGEGFFRELTAFDDPRDVCNPAHYAEVPGDWMLAITDVRGSTKAIEAGRYRDVNLVGAATITAALNAIGSLQIPYVFGGDGATILFPSSRMEQLRPALLAVQSVAEAQFGLGLRVGCVPIAELRAAGLSTRVARMRISDQVHLAMLAGPGPTRAEALIKGSERYLWTTTAEEIPNLEGLECRWRPLEARNGEVLSVLIKAICPDEAQAPEIYRRVIDRLSACTGAHDGLNPAHPRNLKLSLDPRRLAKEHRIKAPHGEPWWRSLRRLLRLWTITLIGKLLIRFGVKTDHLDWGRYPQEVAQHTDFWKYDDLLRFVIDVTLEQKRALLACFEELEASGQIVFGVHASPTALMTCLVFDYAGNHVHFIDGGDGGYAAAAKQLKAKLA